MKVPGAGQLRQRIDIRAVSETPNGAYGVDQDFGVPVRVWAWATPVVGAAYMAAQQIDKTVTHQFVIRTSTEQITARHVIEWRGRRFRVRRVSPMVNHDHFTVIEAEELGAI
ncbi:MAG: phage head closure protein [Alphaproteobacteria bacterium]|nr:MAG: phage head closure protein [Alphaproteobacteria bacterium]